MSSTRSRQARGLEIREDRAIHDLIGSVQDGLAAPPSAWVASVLGLPPSWLPAPYSEYELLCPGMCAA